MARLKRNFVRIKMEGLGQLSKLAKEFPAGARGALASIGYQTKQTLIKDYLSGQDIRLHVLKDRIGRRTVSYSVRWYNATVTVASFPLNLFEHGRKLRSGKRSVPTKTLTQKMPPKAKRIAEQTLEKFLQRVAKDV